MKYFLIYCFIFLPSLGFSQNSVLETYSKIHFVYDRESNYHINEKGVFADTVLLKLDFPEIKYSLRKSPVDSIKMVGFVSMSSFNQEAREKLESIVYHSVEKIEGTYDRKKNRTTLKISRDDVKTRNIFKNVFKSVYYKFNYTIYIDYDEKTIKYRYPNAKYDFDFSEKAIPIEFLNDFKTEGNFQIKTKTLLYDNIIYLNDKLINKIVPDEVFSNNEFGVEKIITIYETISLRSVVYE